MCPDSHLSGHKALHYFFLRLLFCFSRRFAVPSSCMDKLQYPPALGISIQKQSTRILLLKTGGKKALREFDKMNRVTSGMKTGTIVHDDRRRKEKHKTDFLDRRNWEWSGCRRWCLLPLKNSGWTAQIIQHEIDHINGIIIWNKHYGYAGYL